MKDFWRKLWFTICWLGITYIVVWSLMIQGYPAATGFGSLIGIASVGWIIIAWFRD